MASATDIQATSAGVRNLAEKLSAAEQSKFLHGVAKMLDQYALDAVELGRLRRMKKPPSHHVRELLIAAVEEIDAQNAAE